MSTNESQNPTEPRLAETLREDIRRGDLWSTIRREFRELREFYIDAEKKARLDQMGWFKRWLYFTGWILKSMLLRLTPARRLLLFAGIVFVLMAGTVDYKGERVRISNLHLLGGALVVFVLMLELKDKLLARDELEAGRKVQYALMPERSPSVPGWSLWLYTRPANEVGGDLVDFISISTGRSGAVLADVTGKGLKAALLMAKLQATIRALAPDYESVGKLVSKINEIFHRDSLPNMFASLLYVELLSDSDQVRFVNAGHLPPLLITGDGYREMPKGEPALGLMANATFTERTLTLQHGDAFFAYSDGLTEARNGRGEFFGSERLLRLLPSLRGLSTDGIGQAITTEVDRFVGDAGANDDLSLVILKRA